MVLDIDGSVLEGGGQILRMSVALSVLSNKAIRISKIRAGRAKGGLAPQHLKGIELAASISRARVDGVQLGSTSIEFHPGGIRSGEYVADTETAGSVGLLLQVSLPFLLFGEHKSVLTLKGGTNAKMAPQIDYTLMVFKPVLEKFGASFDCNILKRGFYPAGGGAVQITVNPVKELEPINLVDFGKVEYIKGEAFVAGVLPFKMAEEIAKAAEDLLRRSIDADICIKPRKFNQCEAFGNGSGINLVAYTSTGCYLGGSNLGERGVANKDIGRKAAEELLESIKNQVCVDQHTQDQLIIFMALANGKSRIKTGPITSHTETAIHVIRLFSSAKFNIINESCNCNIIECEGQGIDRKAMGIISD